MKIKETTKVFFTLFLLITLLLINEQTLANELVIGNPIAKMANSTLYINDEIEDHKLLHEMPDTRKRKHVVVQVSV